MRYGHRLRRETATPRNRLTLVAELAGDELSKALNQATPEASSAGEVLKDSVSETEIDLERIDTMTVRLHSYVGQSNHPPSKYAMLT